MCGRRSALSIHWLIFCIEAFSWLTPRSLCSLPTSNVYTDRQLNDEEIVSAAIKITRLSRGCLNVWLGWARFRSAICVLRAETFRTKNKIYDIPPLALIRSLFLCLFSDISFAGIAGRRPTDQRVTSKCNHTSGTVPQESCIPVEHAQYEQLRCERIGGTGKIWICEWFRSIEPIFICQYVCCSLASWDTIPRTPALLSTHTITVFDA